MLLLPVAAHLVQEGISFPRCPSAVGGGQPVGVRCWWKGREVEGDGHVRVGFRGPSDPQVLWTGLPGPNLHLLVACAILDMERDTLMLSGFGSNEILKVKRGTSLMQC